MGHFTSPFRILGATWSYIQYRNACCLIYLSKSYTMDFHALPLKELGEMYTYVLDWDPLRWHHLLRKPHHAAWCLSTWSQKRQQPILLWSPSCHSRVVWVKVACFGTHYGGVNYWGSHVMQPIIFQFVWTWSGRITNRHTWQVVEVLKTCLESTDKATIHGGHVVALSGSSLSTADSRVIWVSWLGKRWWLGRPCTQLEWTN